VDRSRDDRTGAPVGPPVNVLSENHTGNVGDEHGSKTGLTGRYTSPCSVIAGPPALGREVWLAGRALGLGTGAQLITGIGFVCTSHAKGSTERDRKTNGDLFVRSTRRFNAGMGRQPN